MNIHTKIEEIRSKPEHQRLKYVWGAVAISMFFVVAIWILSVKISLQKNQDQPQTQPLPDIGQQLQDIKNSAPSLSDVNQLTTGANDSPSPADSSADSDNSSQTGQ